MQTLYRSGKYKKYLEDYAEYRNMDLRDLTSIWNEYVQDAETYNDWTEWGRYIVKYNRELKETLKNKKGIMLSTMHGSKGLEWKHVFIIDCVQGVCPSPKADTDEELEEERRLFYVAMTRAKEHLYLCYYQAEDGKAVVSSPIFCKRPAGINPAGLFLSVHMRPCIFGVFLDPVHLVLPGTLPASESVL